MSEWKTIEAESAFNNILDTFSAADGGKRFICTMMLLKDMDMRADDEYAAGKVVDIMLRFSKLIDLANQEYV